MAADIAWKASFTGTPSVRAFSRSRSTLTEGSSVKEAEVPEFRPLSSCRQFPCLLAKLARPIAAAIPMRKFPRTRQTPPGDANER
jgi:hypothetical protein